MMFRKTFFAMTAAVGAFILPAFLLAQSNTNGAKLGSKDNPIPVTAVGTPVAKSKGKGTKRGSKTNPITGQTHSRSSN